jgi:hypothetical protein
MPAHPAAAWQRLGAMLGQRRVELDPRYKNLALFTEDRGINYRLGWDIEAGRRTNYRRLTLRAIEVAYHLQPGAIDAALTGGHLAVLPRGDRGGDSPADLIRRLDLDQPIDEHMREVLKQTLIGLLERKAAGEERRRA